MMARQLVLAVLLAVWAVHADAATWADVDALLKNQVDTHAFPAVVAAVGNANGIFYVNAFGNFTYGLPSPVTNSNPPAQIDSLFDMASLTKVLVTTTAVMALYQQGLIRMDTLLCDASLLGPAFANNGKQTITVENLMLHNAGFPPDPNPEFWSPGFGCPATSTRDVPEVFTCQSRIYQAVMNLKLDNPVGEVYVYSDLSMITMMYVVGKIAQTHNLVQEADLLPACVKGSQRFGSSSAADAPELFQCYYEAYVRTVIVPTLKLQDFFGFLPDQKDWARCVPTWNDTDGSAPGPGYRNRVIQGQVSDQNAYALGGIAGHAGLFTTVTAASSLTHRLLFAAADDPFINASTVKYFTTIKNVTQSSRALGWDTNNYAMNDYRGCGNFSEPTFMHTGYTGTMVCADPVHQIYTVLLTNRVYPQASDESEDRIHNARQLFQNLVLELMTPPQDSAPAAAHK